MSILGTGYIISGSLLSVVDKELLGLHVLGREADAIQGGVTEGELVLHNPDLRDAHEYLETYVSVGWVDFYL